MLSLNSLSDNHSAARAPLEPKRKASTPGEERVERPDFGSYLAAMAQPLKPEARPETPAVKIDAPKAEKPAPVQDAIPLNTAGATQQSNTQKAGHEAPGEAQATAPARDSLDSHEVAETKTAKVPGPRGEKELLETLGISLKKALPQASTDLKIAANARTDNSTAVKGKQAKLTPAEKNHTAAHTLTQLEKIPDLVLASTDGLKRLSEKLGMAFLSKVGEKLAEKHGKTETTTAQPRAEAKAEHAGVVTSTRIQKTGDGSAQQGFDSQSNTRSARSPKTVSRETIASDTTEKLPVIGGNDLKPLATPDTLTARSNNIHGDIRAADPVTSGRGADMIRAAVENPTLRADLLRQMSDVMTRAQVLVADSQNAQFSVKLFPRELGRVEIDLKLVDGEIKGKIVVESEEVKNEMQNFLQNHDNGSSGQDIDLNRIDIEVRSGNQNAQNPESTPDADALLQNLVTRAAASVYEAPDSGNRSGNALYA